MVAVKNSGRFCQKMYLVFVLASNVEAVRQSFVLTAIRELEIKCPTAVTL